MAEDLRRVRPGLLESDRDTREVPWTREIMDTFTRGSSSRFKKTIEEIYERDSKNGRYQK
jgi:hypothetical protein